MYAQVCLAPFHIRYFVCLDFDTDLNGRRSMLKKIAHSTCISKYIPVSSIKWLQVDSTTHMYSTYNIIHVYVYVAVHMHCNLPITQLVHKILV